MNLTTKLLLFGISFLFSFSFLLQAQTVRNDKYGPGGTETTKTITISDGVQTTVIIKDPNGTTREIKETKIYKRDNGIGGKDNCVEIHFEKNDCNGNLEYSKGTVTINDKEIYYGDANYDPPPAGEKGSVGKRRSGYRRGLDKDGNYTKERWDPKMQIWQPMEAGAKEEKSAEPNAMVCPPSPKNQVALGPSFHQESFEGESESYAGIAVAYLRKVKPQLGIKVDGSLYFKKIGDTKINKFFALAGPSFCPFKKASFNKKVSVSVHALAGIGQFKQKYSFNGMSSKSSRTSFAWAGGAAVTLNLKNDFGVSLQADYGQTKLFDRKQNNLRANLMAMKCFGKKKSKAK